MNNYRLDRKVEIKAVSTLRNAVGEVTADHVLYCRRFAEVMAKPGTDKFSSGADQPVKKWTVRLRFDTKTATILESMVVYYAGLILRVDSVVDEFERHKWILLTCTEHGSDVAGGCSA